MSKKQIYSRLNQIFTDIEESHPVLPSDSLDKLTGWTWECNPDGTYKSVSTEVEKCLGIPATEFLGKSFFEYAIHQDCADELRNKTTDKSHPSEMDVTFFSTEGKWITARLHIFARVGENGNRSGWRGFCQILHTPGNGQTIVPILPPDFNEPIKPRFSSKPAPDDSQVTVIRPKKATASKLQQPSTKLARVPGLSIQEGHIEKATNPWTRAGLESLLTQKAVIQPREDQSPAALAIPFQYGNHGKGILEIVDDQRSNWNEDERSLVQEVANQLSLAIENARLYAAVQSELSDRVRAEDEILRRNLELEAAAEIARDTTSTLSLDTLLHRIVNMVLDRFGFYHAAIYMLNEERQFAVIQEATGEAGLAIKEKNTRIAVASKTIIGTVASTGTTVTVNDVQKSPIFSPNPLLPDTRSELGLPLRLGEKVIGVLDIQSTSVNAFLQDDIAILQILADQIAVAIDNANSYALAQKAIEEMREVDRLKSQFLANMSHELRTPLNSIIGFSRVILKGIDGPINEIQQQDLSAIYNSGQHLLSLINNILDLSKIDAGKMELAFTDVDLNEIIKAVMSTAVGLVKDKPVQLRQNIPADLPIVRADTTRVRQVLLNLISNAAKFTEEGQIVVEVIHSRSPEGKAELMITVTDTGPGIAKVDEVKLFQPFSQVDDSPTRKTGGTGLGLSICRSLIDLHNGRIGLLWSEVGKGSTFFFTLPLQAPELPVEETPETPQLTILAVDDDIQVIRLYERYLSPHGFRVIPATDPKEAVRQAKAIQPFAITLDLMMPEKDGWQVLNDLKTDIDTKDIPVVICSILEEEEKGYNLGASDYLVKPFLREDLLRAVTRLNVDGKIQKILVIDDDPDDLRLVQKMLDDLGRYQISVAEGGKNGWAAIQNNRPDAVILDLFMPDVDGFRILQDLRSDPALINLPVLILSGAELTTEQQRQIDELGQQLISKSSLHNKDLLESLEKALNRYRK